MFFDSLAADLQSQRDAVYLPGANSFDEADAIVQHSETALAHVGKCELAQREARALKVEQVVDELKGHAEVHAVAHTSSGRRMSIATALHELAMSEPVL